MVNPDREWAPFLALELKKTLSTCSGNSAPGPDHVMWVHLKCIVTAPRCLDVFLTLANACLQVGHWLWHFKQHVHGDSKTWKAVLLYTKGI